MRCKEVSLAVGDGDKKQESSRAGFRRDLTPVVTACAELIRPGRYVNARTTQAANDKSCTSVKPAKYLIAGKDENCRWLNAPLLAQRRLTPPDTGTNLKLLRRDIREGEQISRDRPRSIALAT